MVSVVGRMLRHKMCAVSVAVVGGADGGWVIDERADAFAKLILSEMFGSSGVRLYGHRTVFGLDVLSNFFLDDHLLMQEQNQKVPFLALQSVRFPLLFSVVHSVLSFLPSVYAPLPYYPAYSQYPGSYRSSYGLAPYSSSFYGKPSYAYSNPNSGYAGVSAYEGPSYGMNAYWQPGIAYSPNGAYGSYAAGGYGAAAGGYGGAATPYGGLSSPYGGMGGPYGDLCRDRSADCALTASSGQCAMTARILCPQSCGVGCAGGAGLPYPQSPYYVSPSAPMPALNSFYSPFYPYRSLLSSANERKEEKQQKGAKVLFSEDEPTGEQSSWTAGLPSALSTGTGTGTGTGTSIFEQSPSRMSALFNTAATSADGAPLTMSWPPPSSLSTQHSSLSKLVRMDDLVMDKAKEKKTKS